MSASVGQGNLGNAGSINSAIFIDAGYVGKFAKTKHIRISFRDLVYELSSAANLVTCNYYNCMPIVSNPPTADEQRRYANVQKFHNRLKKIDKLKVKLGRLQKIWDDDCQKYQFNQKGVDMQMGVDLVQLSMQGVINKAILIASDSDFVYAIKKAKKANVMTVLAYFPAFEINNSMTDAVDEVIKLEGDLLNRITF